MDTKKALLIAGDSIIDIGGLVQMIAAHDKDTGELKYRGDCIVAFRASHVRGHAVIFLDYKGDQHIFGECVDVYRMASFDYAKFDMRASDMDRLVIGGGIKGLKSL